MARGKPRATKAVVPSGASESVEETFAQQSSRLIVDREIKAELGFGFIIAKHIGRIGEWIERATMEPTLRNFYALYRSLRTLNALVGPYTTDYYKQEKRVIQGNINALEFDKYREDREQAIDYCVDWFELMIEDLHKVGMLFKESIGAIV